MTKAVIFDMDGVLIDSERQSLIDNQQFLASYGKQVSLGEMYFLIGSTDVKNYEYMALKLQVSWEEVQGMYQQYLREHPWDISRIFRSEVLEVFQYLQEKHIKIALASSSPPDFIQQVLKDCEIEKYFDYVVSGRIFKETKPNPEVYFHVCSKLEICANEGLVIEDSEYGILAGKRAGMEVVAVKDELFPLDLSQADYIIEDLRDIVDIVKRRG